MDFSTAMVHAGRNKPRLLCQHAFWIAACSAYHLGMCKAFGVLLLALSSLCAAHSQSPADEVNPLVGTAHEGNTFPGVGVPFGMTAWTPATTATEKKGVIPYSYSADHLLGFRGTHFLSGSATQDYGSFQLLAGMGELSQEVAKRGSAFSHKEEVSLPYRYDVALPDLKIRASVTATARSGVLSSRFDEAGAAWVLIENLARGGDGTLQVDPARREITGINPVRRIYLGNGKLAGFSGYIVVRFDHDFETGQAWQGNGSGAGAPVSMDALKGGKQKAAEFLPSAASVRFHVKQGETITARIGTSFVSVDEARKNLDAEVGSKDFAAIEREAHSAWDKQLGIFEINAPANDRRVFYTSLYHAFQLPRIVSDVNGSRPRFADGRPVQGKEVYYDDFSIWDTFRALHPLFTIIDPDRDSAMIRSLLLKGKEGGFLPIFPAWSSYTSEMIGDHTTAIIGDAYLKGIRGFDVNEAWKLMRRNAFEEPATIEEYKDGRGRRALGDYLRLGYIPLENGVPDAFHQNEQVSRTLEYAYDDFVLARVAKSLGHDADAATLFKRAQNYRNVIDPQTGFARGRHEDGSWATPFDPAKPYKYITEGLPFQYTFFVPQDIPGLMKLVGGRDAFTNKLDELFARNLYDHGNEPSHSITYLYDYAGQAWKTQQEVVKVRAEWYQDRPDGLAGNDDAGQMSAWYIFSMLGFYPVTPGVPAYALGTPGADSIRVHLPSGKTFEVIAKDLSAKNKYVQSVSLNGHPLDRFWIKHDEIVAGGKLVFVMGESPNKKWPGDVRGPE